MKRLKQKLKSESGASILLAMLFFLICALVAAALLMAAVSNAGKIKSNQEMHQKYLTVSSALELVCEDLLSAEYRGQYSFERNAHTTGTGTETVTTYENIYTQEPGAYSDCIFKKMIFGDLNAIFAKQMEIDKLRLKETDSPNEVTIVDIDESLGTVLGTHTIIISAPGTGTMKLSPVKITVTMKENYAIYMIAELEGDTAYRMEAELTPATSSIPQLERRTENSPEGKPYQTKPMTWKLGWITKASKK